MRHHYGLLRRLAGRCAALIVTTATFAGAQAARAADLGWDCCANLEERIAELEATSARKGNRKVSLTISGWVNEAVVFWDDGVESNAYVGTNELEQGRFKLAGDAKILAGWTAGYILEVGINGAGSKSFSQSSAGVSNVTVRKSAWFVKSKELGKVTVGRFDPATYHLLDNVDFTLTRNISDYEAVGRANFAFRLRSNGTFIGTTTWNAIMGGFDNGAPGQSGLRNVVRYDTPAIAGFTGSVAWGEDDQWDTALNFKETIGSFNLAASVGYGESRDPGANGAACAAIAGRTTGNCEWWGLAGTLMHVPTGLFVYGGYAENKAEVTVATADGTSTSWYVQGGIERKWIPLGKTNIFAEYRQEESGVHSASDSASLDFWATGIGQNIENANMTIYGVYRHFDGELANGAITTKLDALDMLIAGAKINF